MKCAALQQFLFHAAKAPFQRRGFGVHSPLAYRLLTEVIAPKNTAYYAEKEFFQRKGTPSTKEKTGQETAALFLRLGFSFPINKVEVTPPSGSDFEKELEKLLVPQCTIAPSEHLHGPFSENECYLLKGIFSASNEEVDTALRKPLPEYLLLLLYATPSTLALCRQIRDQRGGGITIYLRCATLLLLRPDLYPRDYYA